MQLSRLYSNEATEFAPIDFRDGLNLIVAEIRIPANRDLDTHNLGKTTLGQLIDYCLLKGKSPKFFLFSHAELFAKHTFFLELALEDGRYLTIARPVDPGSKCSFLVSEASVEDASASPPDAWEHLDVPFDRSKVLLDGYLNFEALKPWGFRKLVGYLVRSQADYLDVFQLGKFSGKHQEWKPFVAHLLGLSADTVLNLYEKREELDRTTGHLHELAREWGEDVADPSVLDALMSVKRKDIEEKQGTLDSLNFESDDSRVSVEMVEDVDARIAALNEERYKLQQLVKRISESLEQDRIVFRPKDAEKLFREAGVELGAQVRRTYEQLIEFNRSITNERRSALEDQARSADARVAEIESDLRDLNVRRARSLEYLRESEALAKYKEVSGELVRLRSDLLNLESRREAASRLTELRREQRSLQDEVSRAVSAVEAEIETESRDDDSRFGQVRAYFNSIINEVLGQNAILAVTLNDSGGVEFKAEFIGASGLATAGDKGTSYRKLLCIAFDLAVLRAYLDQAFPRFVYHDGAFEQLEPRKREKLLGVLHEYASFGLQPIASALDSDLVFVDEGDWRSEVVVLLHDEGPDGRLFKVESW